MRDADRGVNRTGPQSGNRSVSPSLPLLDGRHEELIASLPELGSKLAAVRLLGHLRSLPELEQSPQALFYHVDTLRHLCELILESVPFTGHITLLNDIQDLMQKAPEIPANQRIPELPAAQKRLAIVLSAELAISNRWEEAVSIIAPMTTRHTQPDSARVSAWQHNFSSFLDFLSRLDSTPSPIAHHPSSDAKRHPIQWPYHLLDPEEHVPEGSALTVLVDGDEIPVAYREAYLAVLTVEASARKQRQPGEPIVRARDQRGEDLPLGDELKDLVREGVKRALSLLGPSARATTHRYQIEVAIAIRRPSVISDIRGRSILLPLVLVLAKQLGEQFNLSGIMVPNPSIIWTGDVDNRGSLKSVSGIELKTTRILASRTKGFAFPEADETEVQNATEKEERKERPLKSYSLGNLFEISSEPEIVGYRNRNILVRTAFEAKRKSRPLGLAGVAIITAFLIALALAIPKLASWLDTKIVEARITPEHDHIELLNSRSRVVEKFEVTTTKLNHPALYDIDNDGDPEVFYGTTVVDSVVSTLFCLDRQGNELWRFKGGFREDAPRPYDVHNTFDAEGVLAHDFDRDGDTEIVAFFSHTPYYPTQIALLTAEGKHISSFWNPGHCGSSLFGHGKHEVAVEDIDSDGYDEILIPGTNNGCNRAILIVLDPRSVTGKGPTCKGDSIPPTWQQYVLFPVHPGLLPAMESKRFHSAEVYISDIEGEPAIRVGEWGALVGLDPNRIGLFGYHLDFDFNVLQFHYPDAFSVWADRARKAGIIDLDISSPEFHDYMKQIEVIPGDPKLMEP